MRVCATLLLPSLLCYFLPVTRTPAHCSLASCQTWFLTPASSLPLFLLCCHAASPLPRVSFWVSHQSLCSACACVCPRTRDSSGMPFSPLLHSCFLRFFLFFYLHLFLIFENTFVISDINAGCEPDSHIAARSQARACWNRDCCTRFRRSLRARIYQQLITRLYTQTRTSVLMPAVQKER